TASVLNAHRQLQWRTRLRPIHPLAPGFQARSRGPGAAQTSCHGRAGVDLRNVCRVIWAGVCLVTLQVRDTAAVSEITVVEAGIVATAGYSPYRAVAADASVVLAGGMGRA